MIRRPRILLFLLACALPATAVRAQNEPVLVSPEVRADRTIIFRYWAPKADDVQLAGEWMATTPLKKDDEGVWTITVGPLAPDRYSYTFVVDGVRTIDPLCRCSYVWGGGRGASSRFTVHSEPPAVWENQNRPAGTLHYERFYSRSQQRTRGAVIYTPPGYEPRSARRYPVIVLLSGTPGDETDWTSGGGSVEIMLDNLIAEGRMVAAIVVMHASDVDPQAETRRGDDNLGQFEKILLDELIPLVRQRYHAKKEAASWAIVGESLGGEFAMAVGLRHPDVFRSIGSISGSLVPRAAEGIPGFDQRFGPALARPGIAKDYQLIWIACGTTDNVCRGSSVFVQRLEGGKIPHVWREFPGAHVGQVFRQELLDVLPRLFR
jgi:enterochelin esterase family protein